MHLALVDGVERARRLVQKHHGRVLQDRPRYRDALALAAGKGRPAFADRRLVSLRQGFDEPMAARRLGRLDNLFVGGVLAPVADVVLHGVLEQVDVLEHHRHVLVVRLGRGMGDVGPAELHCPARRVVEARRQFEQSGLARARRPHNGDSRACAGKNAHALERCRVGSRVRKADTFHRKLRALNTPASGKRFLLQNLENAPTCAGGRLELRPVHDCGGQRIVHTRSHHEEQDEHQRVDLGSHKSGRNGERGRKPRFERDAG